MPTVPSYGDRKVQQAPLPGARLNPGAPVEAFGGGASLDRRTQAANSLAGEAQKLIIEEKDRADQVAVLDADSQLSELETRLQYDPKTGAMNRRGRDAFGLPDEVKTEWEKGTQEIEKSLFNANQRLAFKRMSGSRWASLDSNIQRHVSTQIKEFDNETTSSYLENERDAAAKNFNDHDRVGLSIARQTAALQDHAQRNGLPEEWITNKAGEAASKTHMAVLDQMVSAGLYKEAKGYFDEYHGALTAGDSAAAQRTVEKGILHDRQLTAWGQVSGAGFRRSDGTFDEEKQRAAVFASDLPTETKEAVFDYVKARSGEAHQQLNAARGATDRQFMNQAITARKGGAPMDDVLALADKFSYDPLDLATKQKAIKDLYSNPKDTDPGTYITLWESVQGKLATREDLDHAYTSGKINQADWEGLRKEYWRQQAEGTSPAEKDMNDRLKILADQKFGSNRKAKDSFLYTVGQLGKDKTPEERWKLANDQLKDVDVDYSWFDKPAWEAESKRLDAANLAWGQLHEDLGRDTIQAIGRGALLTGKKAWGLQDVAAFAEGFGGPDGLKPGTPAGNAVRSLMRRGQLVTPANVRAVLSRYKDGNY